MAILAGLAAGIVGGGLSYLGATEAADAASGSMDAATQLQRDIYEQSYEDLDPYMTAGEAGMEGYMTRLGYEYQQVGPDNIWETDENLAIAEQTLKEIRGDADQKAWLDIYAQEWGYDSGDEITAEIFAENIFHGGDLAGWEERWGMGDWQDSMIQGQYGYEPQMEWVIPEGETIGQFGLEDLVLDPGYQFTLNEGTRAQGFGSSASGMTLSGAALKDQQRYTQDYATTKFDEAFDRNQLELQNLYNAGTLGQASAVGAAQTGAQFGTTMAGLQTDQAMIAGASAAAPYNAINTGINTGLAGYNTFSQPGTAGTISPPPLDNSYVGDPINLTI